VIQFVMLIHSFIHAHACTHSQMGCGGKIPGMTLLQVLLYTCSIMRGVTIKIVTLGSYAQSSNVATNGNMYESKPFIERPSHYTIWL